MFKKSASILLIISMVFAMSVSSSATQAVVSETCEYCKETENLLAQIGEYVAKIGNDPPLSDYETENFWVDRPANSGLIPSPWGLHSENSRSQYILTRLKTVFGFTDSEIFSGDVKYPTSQDEYVFVDSSQAIFEFIITTENSSGKFEIALNGTSWDFAVTDTACEICEIGVEEMSAFNEDLALQLHEFLNFATGILQLVLVIIVLIALWKLLNIFF